MGSESGENPTLSAARAKVSHEVTQSAGEIIVFPGSWWHQTLHLSPTLAIASQYVNRHSARHILDGLISRAEIDETSMPGNWRSLLWPEQIQCVVTALAEDGWTPRNHSA